MKRKLHHTTNSTTDDEDLATELDEDVVEHELICQADEARHELHHKRQRFVDEEQQLAVTLDNDS